MSRYQDIEKVEVDGSIITIRVKEVHGDMPTVHEMLEFCPVGESVTVEPDDEPDEGVFEVINGAAIMLFSDHRVAQKFADEELVPQHFVRSVKPISATQIETASSGDPQYEAVFEIEMQQERFAQAFAQSRGWDGYAYVYGDFDDMFF